MKKTLLTIELPFGNSVFIERTAYGAIAAKGDFHPDDLIHTIRIGTARECYCAVSSTARAIRNNRLGRATIRRK